jgi:succinate dehydrogenase / fumarate reductase cytochrome b subunit
LPLGAYLVLHLVVASSATGGRRAFADGMVGLGGGGVALWLEVLLVFIPLVVHVVLGISLWIRPGADSTSPQPSAGFRTLQRATGVAVLVFLAFHLDHTFVVGLGGDANLVYDRLRADMGTPLYLGVYVIGTAAVTLHLATGLPAAARRFSLARSDAAFKGTRIAAGALAVILFALTINTMSHFATGTAFVGPSDEVRR